MIQSNRLTVLFNEFFESEKSGGIVLIFCTAVSLWLANSGISENYSGIWEMSIGNHSFSHWINDGLMTVFFLLIGLELEREVYIGELSKWKNAALPFYSAIGGMIVPAGIYFLINSGTPTQSGIGIPMATDIAFALGIYSLLGNRLPMSLKVILTALAVIDDLGAIIVIAIFYAGTISWINLSISLSVFFALLLLNRLRVHHLIPYIIGGIAMWYFMGHSGVHPSITGVLLAFAIPFGDGKENSVSYKLQHFLHKPVAFIILPLFALANTSIAINYDLLGKLTELNSIGIFAGLVAGKPFGILLFAFLASIAGLCVLPENVSWKHIFGIGLLGGIGFTMSVFITLLAFDNSEFISTSKIAILISSLIASILGYLWLSKTKISVSKANTS